MSTVRRDPSLRKRGVVPVFAVYLRFVDKWIAFISFAWNGVHGVPEGDGKRTEKGALKARLLVGVINYAAIGGKMALRGFFERVRGIEGLPRAVCGA